MSLNERHPDERHFVGFGKRPIHMWERVERAGQVFWVVLDKSLCPISDVALRDVQNAHGDETSTPARFLLVRSAEAKSGSCGFDQKEIDRLAVGAIRRILEQGDATTYEVYEALIGKLECSELGEDVSIDVATLLQDNFSHYETPVAGVRLKMKLWTVNQQRARTRLCVTQMRPDMSHS